MVREVGSGDVNGGGKKTLFIKVFMKLTLESMPLFLAIVRTKYFFLFSRSAL